MEKDNELIEPAGALIEQEKFNLFKIDEIPVFINNTRLCDISDISRIKKYEAFTRASFAYRKYMQYMKRNFHMDSCGFLSGVRYKNGTNIRIELHHTPFTFFELHLIVCNKHIALYGNANEFDVADEVMRLHYMNLVGLYPLSHTIHELVHSDKLDINPYLVNGDWEEFILEYRQYFPDDMLTKADELFKWKNVPKDRISPYLEVKYTFLQIEGIPMYKQIEDLSK
jgi:hypothetical protein